MREIVFYVDSEDNFSVEGAYQVDMSKTNKQFYSFSFWEMIKKKTLYQPGKFTNTGIDLLYLSLMIYYADRLVLRVEEDDAWTRTIKLYVPVLEIEKWIVNKDHMERMISYLTGDIWIFEFRQRNYNEIEEKRLKRMRLSKSKHQPKAICMLSGGLDSFIGAIDLLKNEKNVWFVSCYGGGKGVVEFQEIIRKKMLNKFNLTEKQFFRFYIAPVNKNKEKQLEDSTRSRSFMFFAHAIVLGSANVNDTILYIPENGLISLNIPLTNTRLGSCSTRTTHPYYIGLLQELITNIGIKIKLFNPYQFKTKGEMISECSDQEFLKDNIEHTMSCSHPHQTRYEKKDPAHCGTCLPCVIRRAAIEKAYGKDTSNYSDMDFTKKGASSNLRSYKIGIYDFMNSKTDKYLTIQMSGKILNNLEEYSGVYERGMRELKQLLDRYDA